MKKLKRKQVQNYVKKNVNDKLYNIYGYDGDEL